MDGIGAHQQGYDDAMYDGIDTFGEFGCNCEKCKTDYEAGWNEGMEELERSLIQHAKNFVPSTPPATSYVEDTSGAKFPKSYTFEGVNNFVFSTNVGFEDLQSLCLDLVSRLEKSNAAQQSVHPTCGDSAPLQALSTPEADTIAGHLSTPPTSG